MFSVEFLVTAVFLQQRFIQITYYMMSYLEAEIKVCSYFSYPIFSCEVRVVHRLNICDNLYFEPADQHVNKEALK